MRMPEKRRLSESDKSKIAEKSKFVWLLSISLSNVGSTFLLVSYFLAFRIVCFSIGFHIAHGVQCGFQVIIAKELNRPVWMCAENLGRKQCRELLYLLYVADTATLLSFTVCLGRVIWESNLRAKRRSLRNKLLERVRLRERGRLKNQSGKLPGVVVVAGRVGKSGSLKEGTGNVGLFVKLGFRLRPISAFRVATHRCVKGQNAEFGSRMYRLALAMRFLSFRNICVTSEWEFWAVYLVKQVFGFWRSIAIGGELNDSFNGIADALGFDVVSCEVLERLQSCLRCSSTTRYQGPGRD